MLRRFITVLAGTTGALLYAAMAYWSHQTGGIDVFLFLSIMALAFVTVFSLYFAVSSGRAEISVRVLIFWALVFRIIGLFGLPILEDDFYRYLLDGCVFASTGSPYDIAPASFFANMTLPTGCEGLPARVNNPDIPTIYGPTLQYIFAVSYVIAPANLLPIKLVLLVMDIGLVFLLIRLAPLKHVLLYAWCPLAVKETAFTAHPDLIGIFLIVAAFVLASRKQLIGSAVIAALAVGAKIFALLLVPYLVFKLRKRDWFVFVVTLALLYLPFVLKGSTDASVLGMFAKEWMFNASIVLVLKDWLPDIQARTLALAMFIIFWCGLFWQTARRRNQTGYDTVLPQGDLIFGVFLLLSPVANAWYVLWLLPFAVVSGRAWVWAASVVVLLTYITGLNLYSYDLPYELGAYQNPSWVMPLEIAVILLAFALQKAWPYLRNLCKSHDRSA